MGYGFILRLLGMLSGINIKAVLAVVLNFWREILIALLAVVVLYQNTADVRFVFGAQTIPALERELAESQENLRVCGDGNKKLSVAIDENNARIDAYGKLAEDLKQNIKDLQADLVKTRAKSNTAVEVILKDPTPKTCEKAIDYLRDAGKEIKW